MRYEVRFANGYWRVFDTHRYTTQGLCDLKKDAEAFADKLNTRP